MGVFGSVVNALRTLETIAIIPDGNRRYAKKYSLSSEAAYSKGIERVLEAIVWCKHAGVKRVAIYGYSLDNWDKRSMLERELVLRLYLDKAVEALMTPFEDSEFDLRGVKLEFFGDLKRLPDKLQKALRELEDKTKNEDKLVASIALCYSSRAELEKPRKLQYPFDIDLMVRTGGRNRLSDFLLKQSAYAELYFTEKLWPEFTRDDLSKAVSWFYAQESNEGA